MNTIARLRTVCSLFIVAVIAMQASTFVTGTKVWPFMAYCMYADSYGPTPLKAAKHRVIAVTRDGEEFPLTIDVSGLRFFPLQHQFLRPMRNGDSEAGRRLGRRMNRDRDDPIIALRMESDVFTVVDGEVRETLETTTLPLDE